MTGANTFIHDPNAVLDYTWPWGDENWLEADETISSFTFNVPDGLTEVEDPAAQITEAGKSVTVWLSGGTDGVDYDVTCHITTSANREDDRTFRISVRVR